MKKLLLLCTLLAAASCGGSEKPAELPVVGEVNIIPLPNKITRLPGEFEITGQTKIVCKDNAGIFAANTLNDVLIDHGQAPLQITDVDGEEKSITLILGQLSESQREGAYELVVEPDAIRITGSERGLFYGVQSLIQMIPVDLSNGLRIPAAAITDIPRFQYRGFHLDEARHFLGPDFVKKYIALASRYKLNYFHWHLTDDQGWRIAIDKYPRLTEIGSRRSESVRANAYLKKQPYVGDGKPVEGFYTREQILDIVAFAKARSVTIIPEIEMPGHASAAIAAYPQYGCQPGTKVKTTWSAPPDGFADILCPSDETIGFLKDVLDEVMDMFPDSPYVHVGGDETNMTQWRSSKIVQDIKKREGFTDEYQVLKWFIDQMGEHVAQRGKKIICWDDIIEKGQIPNATIMSWKGPKTAKLAALSNREVIITPYERLYFDHPQSNTAEEARSFPPSVNLKSVYSFSIMLQKPTHEETKNIIGGQGCLWTEFIETPDRAEYMAFPRLIALADVLWTGNAGKDYKEFITKRLFNELARLDRMPEGKRLNYRIPEPFDMPDRLFTQDRATAVELIMPIAGGKVFYSLDGSVPNIFTEGYTDGFIPIPPGFEGTVKAIVTQNNARVSPVFEIIYSRQVSRVDVPSAAVVSQPKIVSNGNVPRKSVVPPPQSPAAQATSLKEETK